MVLAAVADLLFSSRIRAAAAAAAAEVRFARTAADVMREAESALPSLLLIDLNAAPLAPIETISRFKADPRLATVRIVGFVSHVQADVIAAARAAGIDEVMARSAFVSKLQELLSS
jgi:PleD family two-component response regulator